MSRIAVGLSGGVDSSTTIAMLQSQGHDVLGLTMKIYDGTIKIHEGTKHACYGPGEKEDIEVCQRLANQLKVPYTVIDLSKEYNKTVIDYFRVEYEKGHTPNPCVMCNQAMKFGFLIRKAKEIGLDFEYFATGHYAQTEQVGNRIYLKRAVNKAKDQSYFLYRLPQETLRQVMFPLGGFTKSEVRAIAKMFNLEVADKPDSQDFIAGGDYSVLFNKIEPGNIVDESGTILGHHSGIIHYTIGQRKGLDIKTGVPHYVKEINAERNEVIVTSDSNSLFNDRLVAQNAFLYDYPTSGSIFAKIRHNSNLAEVDSLSFDPESKKLDIQFVDLQKSITPGQAVVLYQDDYVIGGGEII